MYDSSLHFLVPDPSWRKGRLRKLPRLRDIKQPLSRGAGGSGIAPSSQKLKPNTRKSPKYNCREAPTYPQKRNWYPGWARDNFLG